MSMRCSLIGGESVMLWELTSCRRSRRQAKASFFLDRRIRGYISGGEEARRWERASPQDRIMHYLAHQSRGRPVTLSTHSSASPTAWMSGHKTSLPARYGRLLRWYLTEVLSLMRCIPI